jgi:hypothetical protein
VGGGSSQSPTAPVTNQWVCYLYRIDLAGATPGTSLGGVNAPTLSLSGTTQPNPPLGQIQMGVSFYQVNAAQPAFDLWLDDIIVDWNPVTCAQ